MATEDMKFPLQWPDRYRRTPAERRKSHSRFKTTFASARNGVLRELRLMGASDIIISTNIELNRYGLPYASAREPSDPGIAVYWIRNGRDEAMALDCWTKSADNMHALELAISALRMIERCGSPEIVDRAFQGFAALPANVSSPAKPPWRAVMEYALDAVVTREMVKERYRRLVRKRHPDHGGTDEGFRELRDAYNQALNEIGT